MTENITLARKDVESLHTALKAWIQELNKDDYFFPEWMELSNRINTVLYDS